MAIGHPTPAALRAMREHGHYEFWEVANYADGDSVTVECTKYNEVLVELVNQNMEEEDSSANYSAARVMLRTLDEMEQKGTSQSPDANTLRNTLQDLKLTDEEQEKLDEYSVELRRKGENNAK